MPKVPTYLPTYTRQFQSRFLQLFRRFLQIFHLRNVLFTCNSSDSDINFNIRFLFRSRYTYKNPPIVNRTANIHVSRSTAGPRAVRVLSCRRQPTELPTRRHPRSARRQDERLAVRGELTNAQRWMVPVGLH